MSTAIIVSKSVSSIGIGTIVQWFKNIGDPVNRGEKILKVEFNKKSVEIASEISGFLLSIVCDKGNTIRPGQIVGYIGTAEEAKGVSLAATSSPEAEKESISHNESLQSNNVNQVEILPISRTRKIIAERLSQSMFSAPHYYLNISVDVENLIKARDATVSDGVKKVSFNTFFIKFVAEAMKLYPIINSSWRGDSIAVYKTADIGLAVAQPEGLITPVVRDCGSKNIFQIDAELQILIQKALNRKLLPSEYSNATFTISNLGSFGIDEFTAVINPPGSAILAVGAMKKEPVVDESGSIVARTRMHLTLSCDHRVIDGAVGAKFLKKLGEFIENPEIALA